MTDLPVGALPPPPRALAGRVVAITGASSGVGRSLIDLCLAEGAYVSGFARRAVEGLDPGARFLGAQGDLTRPGDAERWLDETERAAGPVDVLVNNAGALTGFAECFAINVVAPERLIAHLAPGLQRRRRGWIVNVTSDLSYVAAPPALVAYAASKAALNSVTRTWAARLGPAGVHVNGLHPGHVRTAMNPAGPDAPEIAWPMWLTLVTCGPDGPNGRFFGPDGELPWYR